MPPRVVGRAAELEVVDAFLAAADDGPARLLVEGEPGIGKTTVWQAATARARERGFRILASRPGPSETRLTFAGLGDFLADARRRRPRRAARPAATRARRRPSARRSRRACPAATGGLDRVRGNAARPRHGDLRPRRGRRPSVARPSVTTRSRVRPAAARERPGRRPRRGATRRRLDERVRRTAGDEDSAAAVEPRVAPRGPEGGAGHDLPATDARADRGRLVRKPLLRDRSRPRSRRARRARARLRAAPRPGRPDRADRGPAPEAACGHTTGTPRRCRALDAGARSARSRVHPESRGGRRREHRRRRRRAVRPSAARRIRLRERAGRRPSRRASQACSARDEPRGACAAPGPRRRGARRGGCRDARGGCPRRAGAGRSGRRDRAPRARLRPHSRGRAGNPRLATARARRPPLRGRRPAPRVDRPPRHRRQRPRTGHARALLLLRSAARRHRQETPCGFATRHSRRQETIRSFRVEILAAASRMSDDDVARKATYAHDAHELATRPQ